MSSNQRFSQRLNQGLKPDEQKMHQMGQKNNKNNSEVRLGQKNNKNNNEVRQMSSIAKKLHYSWIMKSFGKTVGFDFLLVVVLLFWSIIQREFAAFEGFYKEYHRFFEFGERVAIKWHVPFLDRFQKLYYVVTDAMHEELLRVPMYPILCLIFVVLAILIVIQLVGFIFSYIPDDRKIRRTLQPINDIALRADELSRMAFSEDKYQEIEDAISRLEAEGSSDLLSFGDEDLQGIEAAMNNLLIHMRESYQQQARFVNDASHELRTPIAVIQGYANMLGRWGREDEQVLDESITAIKNEAEHMKYLVEQLLFLARGDSGRTVLKKEELSLNSMMEEIYEESFMIDEEHPYRFRKHEQEVTITADAALLKQAVRILVDNAAKYTNKGDEIILSYGLTEEKRPFIQIQDTGIGMEEKDIAHMFERFYRSDEVRSYQGTGLGLSIAKWIVDKHQGHFEILSRTGLGTRIRIVL